MKKERLTVSFDLEVNFFHDGKENAEKSLKEFLVGQFGTDDKEFLNAIAKQFLMKEMADVAKDVVFDIKLNIDWELE